MERRESYNRVPTLWERCAFLVTQGVRPYWLQATIRAILTNNEDALFYS